MIVQYAAVLWISCYKVPGYFLHWVWKWKVVSASACVQLLSLHSSTLLSLGCTGVSGMPRPASTCIQIGATGLYDCLNLGLSLQAARLGFLTQPGCFLSTCWWRRWGVKCDTKELGDCRLSTVADGAVHLIKDVSVLALGDVIWLYIKYETSWLCITAGVMYASTHALLVDALISNVFGPGDGYERLCSMCILLLCYMGLRF